MAYFERVRISGAMDETGKPKRPASILLEVATESEKFLSGYEVNREGERIFRPGKYDERLHVIDKAVITQRTQMRMNTTYGELEPNS